MYKMMRLLVVLVVMTVTVEAQGHTIITRLSDRQNVSMTEWAAQAANSDLVLIGEVHDNKDHHDLQLDLLRSLRDRRLPIAIGLEMIQVGDQNKLDLWTEGKLTEKAIRVAFLDNWDMDWNLYRDIFIFARDNRIPMVALNVPAAIVRKVSEQGFASLTREERGGLPEGTGCDLKNPQITLLRRSYREVADHLGHGKKFDFFCEAQTVRNSGMAINLLSYLKKHPGQRLVGLTGIWHAVKYAIPEQLERYGSKLSYTVVLPETPELNGANSGTSEADYLVEL